MKSQRKKVMPDEKDNAGLREVNLRLNGIEDKIIALMGERP